MQETIFKLLLTIDDVDNTVVLIISTVVGIISILQEIHSLRDNEQRKKRRRLWSCILIVSILVIIGTITRKNLVTVPSVVGYTYEDAKHVLCNHELKYTLVVDKGLYVTEQSPIASTAVKKGTVVELTTKPIGNNPEVISAWEGYINAEYGRLAVRFKNQDIKLIGSKGDTINCFGYQISDFKVKEAYLLEEKSGVEYHNYSIEEGILLFENIPKGIEFTLYVLLDGYEEAETKVKLSSQNMVEDTFSFSWGMIRSDMETAYPTTFYVANAENSTAMNIDYLANAKLMVQWPYENYWYGDYATNEGGCFEYGILINKDQKIRVTVINPFNNGVDYECEVTLYVPVMGEPMNNDIIFLNKDGTCEVISESEYFRW